MPMDDYFKSSNKHYYKVQSPDNQVKIQALFEEVNRLPRNEKIEWMRDARQQAENGTLPYIEKVVLNKLAYIEHQRRIAKGRRRAAIAISMSKYSPIYSGYNTNPK